MPFILRVDVPNDKNDTCTYQGTDTYDTSVTADIQLCPEVVRIYFVKKNKLFDTLIVYLEFLVWSLGLKQNLVISIFKYSYF